METIKSKLTIKSMNVLHSHGYGIPIASPRTHIYVPSTSYRELHVYTKVNVGYGGLLLESQQQFLQGVLCLNAYGE